MSMMAKVSLKALRDYKASVKDLCDYSIKSNDGVAVFDELIEALTQEKTELSNINESLKTANTEIDDKINHYNDEKNKIEHEVDVLNRELDRARAELASTPRTITISDGDGNSVNIPNPTYIALEARIASLVTQIANLNTQICTLIGKIERCNILRGRLSAVSSQISGRIASLEGNKNMVTKLKNQYESNRKSLSVNSNNAVAKLNSIEKIINEYTNTRLNITSAYDRTRNAGTKSIDELGYVTEKFTRHEAEVQSKKKYTDDNGKVFRTKDGLVPNGSFIIGGISYTTDSKGRPLGASGKLTLATEKKNRNWDSNLHDMGKGYEKENDERGHIIGHRFGGPESMINAIPQDLTINRKVYKEFEDELDKSLSEGKEVYVSIKPMYKGNSHRPNGLYAVYTVDGVTSTRWFPNAYKEG